MVSGDTAVSLVVSRSTVISLLSEKMSLVQRRYLCLVTAVPHKGTKKAIKEILNNIIGNWKVIYFGK